MAKADMILIEGRFYTWRQLRAMRREQRETRRATEGRQLALFELKEDSRRKPEKRSNSSILL